MGRRNLGIAVASVGLAASIAFSVALADVAFGPHDVPTVFFVSKSDDDNRVDYGVRLDPQCHPASTSPMAVYWREFENGSAGRVTHGLNLLEVPAYDAADQRIVARADSGGATLALTIRALRTREITIRTWRRAPPERGCAARASMRIAGVEAILDHVHLTLAGPGAVRYADVNGHTAAGRTVTERIER